MRLRHTFVRASIGGMATKVVTKLEDDVDGSDASETIEFTVDGVEYAIDLSDENAKKLRGDLERFVRAARRVGGSRRPAAKRPATGKRDPGQSDAIRAWAREHGHQVSDRGRISARITQAYKDAHGR